MTKYETRTTASMPDFEERHGLYDPVEEYPWDFDNGYPLDPEDDGEDDGDEE